MTVFPKRLKEYRESLKEEDGKWTQKYVANKIGVARVTYTAYENGTKMPPFDTINSIANLFDIKTDYLMGRTDNPKKSEDNDRDTIINKIATEFPDIDLMFKDMENMTADDFQDIYDYIKFKMSQKEKGD